ncbi:helix-turn-helix transcriptional regulator [Actinomadura harenae]|uniref:helix-turn-helix transcriptional regulator n=1 Tax=Actinomadura harenae TaxID=2483351 RepID=UPI002D792545|nr:YafY family protein [Actinomadura harenae]
MVDVRASRLISLVLLLQSRGEMTAADLAAELEVSERTVYRDVEALSAAGVPVYADRGPGGGYRLVGGYRTRLTGLTREEAEALFLAGLRGPAGDMGLADAVATAELKVRAALPPVLQDAPLRAGQRFHLDAPGWFGDPSPPAPLRDLARAVWTDERVEIRYRRGREVVREVEPYGLVLKNGGWYLVARVGDGHRTYRVDRITGVRPLGGHFARDEGFDLAGFWRESTAAFLRGMLRDEVTVRLSPGGLRSLRFHLGEEAAAHAREASAPPGEDGWVTVVLPVESADVAFSQLLGLGPDVEVLAPAGLRARMAEATGRAADLYR